MSFENGSSLSCENGSSLSFENGSNLFFENGSNLSIENGSSLSCENGSGVFFENGSNLSIENGCSSSLETSLVTADGAAETARMRAQLVLQSICHAPVTFVHKNINNEVSVIIFINFTDHSHLFLRPVFSSRPS